MRERTTKGRRMQGRTVKGRRAAGGFTLAEILITIAITMVGFAAIFQMQLGSVQGNTMARELTAATNLAERYVEQLRREAYQWTQLDRPGPNLNRLQDTWHSLTPLPIDHNGLPLKDDEPTGQGSRYPRQRFCVHYWLTPEEGVYDGILSLNVRVVWPRSTTEFGALGDVCEKADLFVPDASKWYSLNIPATVRRHPG